MTTINFREPGEFGEGATMATHRVSKEQIEAMLDTLIEDAAWQGQASQIGYMAGDPQADADEKDVADARAAILSRFRTLERELQSLRTSSGGVTSGEVVTDEMVERFKAEVRTDADVHISPKAVRVGLTAALSSLHAHPEGHPDDLAVDRFAAAMKEKLAKKRAEGRGGWERKDECSAEFLSRLLREHVEKGDPLDVGNLAMMLYQRGETIDQPQGTGSREAVAWLHPTAGWASAAHNVVMNHCRVDGSDGGPVPLVPLAQLQAVERERDEAQDEIARLTFDLAALNREWQKEHTRAETAEASLAAAREALKPFAAIAEDYSEAEDDSFQVWKDFDTLGSSLPLSIFRRARAALAGSNGE